jgi:hypothetical protein
LKWPLRGSCGRQRCGGRGHILANTDAIPEGADIEEVRAMVEFAKTYGKT